MDVNGLPFRLVTGARDFGFAADAEGAKVAAHLAMSETNGHLRLASEQSAPADAEGEMFARALITQPSPVADQLGGFAWWNGDLAPGRIHASGFLPGATEIRLVRDEDDLSPEAEVLRALVGVTPSDMALGEDDVLYVARGGGVTWHDLRGRWPTLAVTHQSLKADLLAPAPGGGGWAFDRTNRRLLRLRGLPLRFEGLREPSVAEFSPVEPNRDPPRLIEANGRIAAKFDAVALACSPGGRLALLAWESGKDAAVFTYGEDGFTEHGRLKGLRFPIGLAWVGEDGVAVAATKGDAIAPQAYVYALTGAPVAGRDLLPEGRIRPFQRAWAGGLCNALGPIPRHLQADTPDGEPNAIRPLHALSGGHYAREGRVLIGPIDGGAAGCAWHRLYAEAALADGSAIDLQLHASDLAADPAMPSGLDDPAWALHRLLPHRREDTPAGTPVAAWLPQPSEIANAPALLACEARADKAGLFTLLVQHAGRKVRRVTGRYLWIALTLRGDSQTTPELAALRIYAHRLSWRDKYLPAFYGETLGGSDGEAPGSATRHDFMERLLHGHEGALTELEGRIAGAWQLTDPATAPEPALPWIGGWIGVPSVPGEATARVRQRLLAAPHTAMLGGTAGGLMAALELATGGTLVEGGRLDPGKRVPAPGELAVARDGEFAVRGLMLAARTGGDCVFLTGGSVTRGDIVVVEGFRLRRTFATILGADLVDEEDPLTLGMGTSGNSFVGDTLILGDRARDELLSLYRPEIDASRGDTEAVAAFYARLAWRVLVLVRGVSDPAEFKRLKDVVEAEIPAHVEPQVLHARNPLIVGASSLIGLDTFLAEPEPFRRVRLGETALGGGDFVAGRGGLDARADGPVPARPVARADGPAEVWVGNSFTLSALASRAAEQRRINRYVWMWEKES